jgi:hypothetical protein
VSKIDIATGAVTRIDSSSIETSRGISASSSNVIVANNYGVGLSGPVEVS